MDPAGERSHPGESAVPETTVAPPDEPGPEAPPIGATTTEPAAEAPTASVAGEAPTGSGEHRGDGASREPDRKAASAGRHARTSPAVADPAPLGFAGLGLTLFVLSLFESALLPEAGEPVVLGLAFAYGGVALLLAGMWEFRAGSTFGATAFTSYGAFWISFFLLEVFFADSIPGSDLPLYLGWTLIAWAIFTTYMYIASFRFTGRVNAVFLLLAATFYLLGIGAVIGADIVTQVGGYVGLVTAVAAGYASYAALTDETFRRKVLPGKELD